MSIPFLHLSWQPNYKSNCSAFDTILNVTKQATRLNVLFTPKTLGMLSAEIQKDCFGCTQWQIEITGMAVLVLIRTAGPLVFNTFDLVLLKNYQEPYKWTLSDFVLLKPSRRLGQQCLELFEYIQLKVLQHYNKQNPFQELSNIFNYGKMKNGITCVFMQEISHFRLE